MDGLGMVVVLKAISVFRRAFDKGEFYSFSTDIVSQTRVRRQLSEGKIVRPLHTRSSGINDGKNDNKVSETLITRRFTIPARKIRNLREKCTALASDGLNHEQHDDGNQNAFSSNDIATALLCLCLT
ncbi:hypothetical protein AWENTII_011170 [Aspergillus wentii]